MVYITSGASMIDPTVLWILASVVVLIVGRHRRRRHHVPRLLGLGSTKEAIAKTHEDMCPCQRCERMRGAWTLHAKIGTAEYCTVCQSLRQHRADGTCTTDDLGGRRWN